MAVVLAAGVPPPTKVGDRENARKTFIATF